MNNHDTMKERAQYSGNHIGVLFGDALRCLQISNIQRIFDFRRRISKERGGEHGYNSCSHSASSLYHNRLNEKFLITYPLRKQGVFFYSSFQAGQRNTPISRRNGPYRRCRLFAYNYTFYNSARVRAFIAQIRYILIIAQNTILSAFYRPLVSMYYPAVSNGLRAISARLKACFRRGIEGLHSA